MSDEKRADGEPAFLGVDIQKYLDDPELTVNSLSASLLDRREDPSAITMED